MMHLMETETRVSNSTFSIIDVVYINGKVKVVKTGAVHLPSISHHNLKYFCMETAVNIQERMVENY